MADKQPKWKDIPIGGVITEAGNAFQYNTGDWRSERPFVDMEKCIHCLQCWVFCPDASVLVENEKMSGFDYVHCKGCGICAHVCPVNAIEMVPEGEADKVAADQWGIKEKKTASESGKEKPAK